MHGRRRYLIIFVLIAACAAAIFLYARRDQVYASMNDWKLLPQPEQFTELYFNNYLSLPKTSVAGKPFTFSFTIHNIENATTVYPYAVYFKYPDGARTTLRTGSVTLANDATTTIPITYTFQTSDLHGEVVVALTELNQTIDFILPNTNP